MSDFSSRLGRETRKQSTWRRPLTTSSLLWLSSIKCPQNIKFWFDSRSLVTSRRKKRKRNGEIEQWMNFTYLCVYNNGACSFTYWNVNFFAEAYRHWEEAATVGVVPSHPRYSFILIDHEQELYTTIINIEETIVNYKLVSVMDK